MVLVQIFKEELILIHHKIETEGALPNSMNPKLVKYLNHTNTQENTQGRDLQINIAYKC